jgi:hypothetical protein
VWVLKGKENKVEEAFEFCDRIRGHELPYALDVYECKECPNPSCSIAERKGNTRIEEDPTTMVLKKTTI